MHSIMREFDEPPTCCAPVILSLRNTYLTVCSEVLTKSLFERVGLPAEPHNVLANPDAMKCGCIATSLEAGAT